VLSFIGIADSVEEMSQPIHDHAREQLQAGALDLSAICNGSGQEQGVKLHPNACVFDNAEATFSNSRSVFAAVYVDQSLRRHRESSF
jgi:hypothetical protein